MSGSGLHRSVLIPCKLCMEKSSISSESESSLIASVLTLFLALFVSFISMHLFLFTFLSVFVLFSVSGLASLCNACSSCRDRRVHSPVCIHCPVCIYLRSRGIFNRFSSSTAQFIIFCFFFF